MAERNLQINMKIGLQQAKSSIGAFRGSLNGLKGAFRALGRVGGKSISFLKRKLQGLRGISNLIKSSFRAVFRTGIVAGFFFAFRAGMQTITNLKESIMGLTGEFAKLRLKATETAAIITGGGDAFTATFQEALTLARQLSTEIGFTAQEIQNGLVTAARSGLSLTDSFNLTNSAMMLATANGEDFQTTLNDLIGVSRAFNVELDDMGTFADALSAAVTKSNVSLGGLFAGLKKVAPVASTAFGSSAETIADTTAALMTLNDTGMQSERAGTGLRAAMQKLLGGTGRTTTAFAKYGINMFKANGESQKYLDTLLKAQKATQGTEDKINSLKNAEMEMLIAGKQNTSAFQDIQKELGETDSYLNTLKKGLDTVYEQFTLAGGKLKPLSAVLDEIASKAPIEVVGRAFGIRGGAPMMQILQNIEKFKKFKKIVEESQEASAKGQSLTKDMYMKFLDTVLIGWQRIKNTAMAILGSIGDGFFEAVKPLIGPVQNVLTDIFNAIDKHKGAFAEIFKGVADLLLPVLAQMQMFGQGFGLALSDVLTKGSEANVPVLRPDGKEGQLKIEHVKITGTVPEKLKKAFKLLGESFISVLRAGLKKLNPAFKYLAEVFADGFAVSIQAKSMLLMNIGAKIGGAMALAFGKAFMAAVPDMLQAFADISSTLGIGDKIRVGGKVLGMDISNPFGAGNTQKAATAVKAKKQQEEDNKANIANKNKTGFSRLHQITNTPSGASSWITPSSLKFSNSGDSLKGALDGLKAGTTKQNENAIILRNGVWTNQKAIEATNRLIKQYGAQR